MTSAERMLPWTLKKKLTSMQFKVTQEDGTEPAFNNEYWDIHNPGILFDIVSEEPRFSSLDNYDPGTGWPSFTKPLEPRNIMEKGDSNWFMTRTEIRSRHADSHLGHEFNDDPEPTCLRYCMNSAIDDAREILRKFETVKPATS